MNVVKEFTRNSSLKKHRETIHELSQQQFQQQLIQKQMQQLSGVIQRMSLRSHFSNS